MKMSRDIKDTTLTGGGLVHKWSTPKEDHFLQQYNPNPNLPSHYWQSNEPTSTTDRFVYGILRLELENGKYVSDIRVVDC